MIGPDLDQEPSRLGSATAPETLRLVAEEVRTSFPRPPRAPELVLIDVDPRHIHAFWTLSPATVEAARRALPQGGAEAPMILRLYALPASGKEGAALDVEVVGLQGRSYVDIWDEPRRYRGELGLRRADGTLVPLAGPAAVELPPLGPAAEQLDTTGKQAERRDGQAPAPTRSEPVRHPFPLPPTEPSDFTPEHPTGRAEAAAGDAEGKHHRAAMWPSERESARPFVQREPSGPMSQEIPEPVRHPFPLPPTEPSEFVPEALIGGFLPATPESSPDDLRSRERAAAPPEQDHGQPAPTGDIRSEEARAPTEGGSAPLPLENVLTLSSWVLGRETVEFEVNAELHIFGRARSGAQLQLFGRKVTLRPDGSFSITRPLPNGALVLSSLLVDSDDEGGER